MNDPTRRRHGDIPGDPLLMIAALTDPPSPPTAQDMATFGLSRETRKLIKRAIELDPALEELILQIADSAYSDGEESQDT